MSDTKEQLDKLSIGSGIAIAGLAFAFAVFLTFAGTDFGIFKDLDCPRMCAETVDNTSFDIKSNPYRCDAQMCKGWKEDCPDVKMGCEVCCDQTENYINK